MPLKASMLVLIARAARSVAAATDRLARVAEQAALPPKAETTAAASHVLHCVGAGDLVMHWPVAGPPPGAMAGTPPATYAPNHRVEGWRGYGISKAPKFVAQEKDLESDEALWALYERWCKFFSQKRDHDEMVSRFSKFKEAVLHIHHTNNANLPYKLAINKFADGKLKELCCNPDKLGNMLSKLAGKSTFLWKGGGRFLRQVYADYKVVNGKVFVIYPRGSKRGCTEELSVDYEVFALDLPAGHELVVPGPDLL